jgi:hypothetical protein
VKWLREKKGKEVNFGWSSFFFDGRVTSAFFALQKKEKKKREVGRVKKVIKGEKGQGR